MDWTWLSTSNDNYRDVWFDFSRYFKKAIIKEINKLKITLPSQVSIKFRYICLLNFVIMIYRTKSYLFYILFTFIGSAFHAKGSHLMGGQITYKYVKGNEYSFTLEIFRDCRGIPFNSPTISIRGLTGCSSTATPTASRISIIEVTPSCKGYCSPSNQTIGGGKLMVEKHVYTFSYDFTTFIKNGCCQVQIGAGQCCRNGAITTGGSGNDFWVISMIDLCKKTNNNSPVFLNNPLVILGCNLPVYTNIGAIDYKDNDSLVYEFTDPMTDWTGKTTWSGGRSSQSPHSVYCLGSCTPALPRANPPRGTYIDRNSGDLIFTPNDCSEVSIMACKISEYRKDSTGKYVLIGYITQDCQRSVANLTTNIIPTISGPQIIYMADSSEINIEFATKDDVIIPKTGNPILNDTVKLKLLPFTPLNNTSASLRLVDSSKKQPTGIFKWKPMGMSNSRPYLMLLEVRDNNCDYYGMSNKSVQIYVRKKSELAWVEGTTFNDINHNCKKDSFEKIIPNAWVSSDGGNSITFTSDSMGKFSGWFASGTATLKLTGNFSNYICSKTITLTAGKTNTIELGGTNSKMYLSGTVYTDTIKNCKADSLEPRIKNQIIYTVPGDFTSTSDSKGQWSLIVPAGDYKVLTVPQRFTSLKCPTTSHTASIYTDSVFNKLDIGIIDSTNIVDLSAKLFTSDNSRRGFYTTTTLFVKNDGRKTISNATVWIHFNKKLKYYQSSGYLTKTDSTLKFSVPTLKTDESSKFYIVLHADSKTCNVGDTMSFWAWLDTTSLSNDRLKSNNYDKQKTKIVAAYDPNIKEEHNTNGYAWREGNRLRYFIQFQNTGNDTAVNITVIDTLPPQLLGRSFVFNGASHNYEYLITNNVLKVTFANIYLPDTSKSKEKSIGHFDFEIDIDPRINNEVKFYNQADIYFDYAKPVKTTKKYITYTSYVKTGQTDNKIYCSNDTIKVDYSSHFTFDSSNKFKAVLSNSSGSFNSGTKVLDSIKSNSPSGKFKLLIPSGTTESNLYKIKIISTNPAGSILEDAVSNNFSITTSSVKPSLKVKDTLICGKDSIQLTITSPYSSFKIYDRKTLITSITQKTTKIKLGYGKHYLTVSAAFTSNCFITSDTLIFTTDTFPNISLSCTSHSNLKVCGDDTVVLKISGSNKFDLLGNSFAFIKSYTGTEAKITIPNTNDVRSAKFTGNSGCSDTSNVLKFTRFTVPNVGITSSDADYKICTTDSVTFGGKNAATYQLFKNGSPFGTTFTNTITLGGIKQNDKFQIYGSDTTGCGDSSVILKFTVDSVPNVKLNCTDADLVLCNYNTSATFGFSGATTYNLYKNGSFWTVPSSNPYTASGIANNDVIHVEGAVNGCKALSNKLKFRISTPSATLTVKNASNLCTGDSVYLSFSGGVSYLLYKNNTLLATVKSQSYTYLGLSNNDKLYIESVDSFGCIAKSTTVTLTLKTKPNIRLNNYDVDNTHCNGDQVLLFLLGGVSYDLYKNGVVWQKGLTNSYKTTDVNDNDELYTIGLGSNGCYNTSAKLKFKVIALPTVTMTTQNGSVLCFKDSGYFKFNGAVKYDLYRNDTLLKQITDSFIYFNDFIDGDILHVIGTSANGCKNISNKIKVSLNPPPKITIYNRDADNTQCKGEEVILDLNGGVKYDLYNNDKLWKTSISNPAKFNDASDNDIIYAKGYSADGCPNPSNKITLSVLPTPTMEISNPDNDNSTCEGETITLNLSGTSVIDLYKNDILWKANTGTSVNFTDIKNNDEIYSQGKGTNGCTGISNTIKFTVWPKPIISFTNPNADHSTCDGENVTLKLKGASKYDVYKNDFLWKKNSDTVISFTDTKNKDQYYSIGYSDKECLDTSIKLELRVWPTPSKPSIKQVGKILESNYSTGNQWFEGTSKLIGATNQQYSPVKTATYFVIHTDANGCASPLSDGFSFSLSASKLQITGLRIYPNPASDFIIIETGETAHYTLQLFDLTGKLIKEADFIGKLYEWQIKPAKGLYQLKVINEKGQVENMSVEFK